MFSAGDMSHGVTNIDLFLFDTSLMGYTCDYVDADGGAYPGTRAALNQLGMFEDIIVEGVVQPRGAAGKKKRLVCAMVG
jgi:hypothetical protein